jgi:hypothetical protein
MPRTDTSGRGRDESAEPRVALGHLGDQGHDDAGQGGLEQQIEHEP